MCAVIDETKICKICITPTKKKKVYIPNNKTRKKPLKKYL